MTRFTLLFTSLGIVLASLLPAMTAQALPKTFVASTGSGSTCSRAAPCQTLLAAHNATDAGGEINCLDSGPFGAFLSYTTITKSITIDCAGTAMGDSIIVNAPDIVVRLRNLTIGLGPDGFTGINYIDGAALFVENCVIQRSIVTPGIGIKVAPGGGSTARLYVTDSVITGNGLAASGGGIVIQPTGTGSARVVIERTRVENNTYGIFANGAGSTGLIAVQIRDSGVSGNAFNGISAYTATGQSVTSITVERSSSTLNGGDGILAQGSVGYVTLAASTVVSNVTGLHTVSGGNIFSYQDNHLSGNVTDGTPTATVVVK
jgi:hypothetical protein